MQNSKKQMLVYQLRKCLPQLLKAYNLALGCDDAETAKELKWMMTQVKKRMKLISSGK
jgi:hypothetical protein